MNMKSVAKRSWKANSRTYRECKTKCKSHDRNDHRSSRRTLIFSAALASCLERAALHDAGMVQAAPQIVSKAWEKIGGGSPDIFYPTLFEGCWEVASTLVSLETPSGIEMTQDAEQIQQTRDNELNKTLRYKQCFIRNSVDEVIADRKNNTKFLTEAIIGPQDIEYTWDPDNPNILKLNLPGGTNIFTRVTKRYTKQTAEDALETSELFEQVFDKGFGKPKVKASRLLTKWKWRDIAPEGAPQIVASQTLNNYVTPIDSDDVAFANLSNPVSVFRYRMAFVKMD